MRPDDIIKGSYRLEQELGVGGNGVVWSARQLGTQRRETVWEFFQRHRLP